MQQLPPNEFTKWKYGNKSYKDTKPINKWFNKPQKYENANTSKNNKIPSLWLLKWDKSTCTQTRERRTKIRINVKDMILPLSDSWSQLTCT